MAEFVNDAMEENSVAVTVFSPPRKADALIEALYDVKPNLGLVNARLQILALFYSAELPLATLSRVAEVDWVKKVTADFPPLDAGRWTIYGSAYKDNFRSKRQALQIDATSAFGTGEHPTTKGVLIMLDKLLKSPRRFLHFEGRGRVLDIGCGSGILAMAFAKTKRTLVAAVDCDVGSVKIAAENARLNGVAKYVRPITGQGCRNPLVKSQGPYDLIMANIFSQPLCHMAKDVKKHLRLGGMVILSGILNCQAEAVLSAYRQQGIYCVSKFQLGEWSVLALRRRFKA